VVVFNASTSPMKERYAVSDSNVIKLAQPGAFTDSLTEILRSGARALLTQAVEAEVAEFLAKHTDLKTETGQQRVVRHRHLPEREIMTPTAVLPATGLPRPLRRTLAGSEPALVSGTYDLGVETLTAESLAVTDRRTIHVHPATGAETRVFTVAPTRPQ
jgi:hypothetical protein